MTYTCSGILELIGMIVGVGAWLCSLAATFMPSWLSMSPDLMIIETHLVGLWEFCVVHEEGGTECRPIKLRLSLSETLKLARACMCASDGLGLLGLLIAVPCLELMKRFGWSQGWRVKRNMKITAGVLGLMASFFVLYPVSTVARETAVVYHDSTLPDVLSRWEFGNAMFVGWAAGFFYVVSVIFFFASCCGSEKTEISAN